MVTEMYLLKYNATYSGASELIFQRDPCAASKSKPSKNQHAEDKNVLYVLVPV
jgi:hypothetical protein